MSLKTLWRWLMEKPEDVIRDLEARISRAESVIAEAFGKDKSGIDAALVKYRAALDDAAENRLHDLGAKAMTGELSGTESERVSSLLLRSLETDRYKAMLERGDAKFRYGVLVEADTGTPLRPANFEDAQAFINRKAESEGRGPLRYTVVSLDGRDCRLESVPR